MQRRIPRLAVSDNVMIETLRTHLGLLLLYLAVVLTETCQ